MTSEACVKHGPMPDFRAGGYWCDCLSPTSLLCKLDRATTTTAERSSPAARSRQAEEEGKA